MNGSLTRRPDQQAATRNPERTKERILAAAFREFAGKGFAGARVDSIARRASINKRMLYHYFGDKESLFRHVLRRKMAQRQAWGVATPDEPSESLPYWFELACKDRDWIRLLEWEALQFDGQRLIDQDRRANAAGDAVRRIDRRQKSGHLSKKLEAKSILLAMLGVTWFPVAFPQLTRLITGCAVSDARFIKSHSDFLRRFGAAFKAAAILVTVVALAGCSRKASPAEASKAGTKPTVPVVVAKAEAKDVPVELRNIGNVEAYSTVTIRSQITGQVIKVHFREGQEVKAGDMLFTIDPRPAQGALKQAQADLKRDQAQLTSARLEFERQKKLLDSNIASKDDYDKAEANFNALGATVMADEAAVGRAELNVEFTAIRSPIDGRTGNLMVKEGNIVKAPDDSLVTINQVQPIYVTFSVPEQDLPAIRRRMRDAALVVQVQPPGSDTIGDLAADPRGELTFIDNAVDATTGRIKLKATFPNTDNSLWPGQFVQTTLVVDTRVHATVVPSAAVQSSQSGDFVFVVKSDSTVQKRSVTTGLSRAGTIIIESGVQPAETVVTDGQLRLAEGSRVTIHSPEGVTAAKDAAGGAP